MGEIQAVYKQGMASKLSNAFGSLLFLLAGGYVLYYGLNYKNVYPDVAATNTPFIVGFALILIGAGGYWAWTLFSRWNEVAVLYQNGFAHFNGRDVTSFQWNDITSITAKVTRMTVYHFIPAGTMRKYIFESPSARLKLDGTLSGVDELVNQIRQNVFPIMVNRLSQELNAGKTLSFGPISISRTEGIRSKNKKYAWADVAGLRVVNGILEVVPKKKGLFGRISSDIGFIPNLDILIALSTDMIRQHNQNS
ncbi:MAG: DUF6585 family protein [Chloroflexota bacterium]